MNNQYNNKSIISPDAISLVDRLLVITNPGPHAMPNVFSSQQVMDGFWFEIRVGPSGATLQTVDGTIFFINSSNSYTFTEGYYRIKYYGSFWHIHKFDTTSGGLTVRYVHLNIVNWTDAITVGAYRSMVGIHDDFAGWILESITYVVHTPGGRGTTSIELGQNGVFLGIPAEMGDTEKCITQEYNIEHSICDDYTWRVGSVQSAAPEGLSVDFKFRAP